jgi:hypothetical protein
MIYKYMVLDRVDPNLLKKELDTAGLIGWRLIHLQPLTSVSSGINMNGVPIVKLHYHLTFIKEIEDAKKDN